MDERGLRTGDPSVDPATADELPPELRAVALRYAAQPVPRPTPDDTARLVARLLVEEPVAPLTARPRLGHVLPALRVARWRLRLLGPWFWVTSIVLLFCGAVLTPFVHGPSVALPLVVLAPLTAVLGLAHAARTSSGGLRAVEASAPIGFVEVTTGLVLAIVGFDCTLGAAATLGVALLHWAPFATLLAAWLCPLLLLAGISLPIALRWGTIPAAVIGGGPWLLLAALALLQPDSMYAQAFALPRDAPSLTAHAAAAALGVALLLLIFARGSSWLALVDAAPSWRGGGDG